MISEYLMGVYLKGGGGSTANGKTPIFDVSHD